jgi:hypothetical protein
MSQPRSAEKSAPQSNPGAEASPPASAELSAEALDRTAGGVSDLHVTKTTDKSSADLFLKAP